MLKEPSEQQKVIVSAVENNNVIVDAVAGSGKTTTVLHIAKNYPNNSILLLTYNRSTRIETQEKIKKLELKNIVSSNYHKFVTDFYAQDLEDNLAIHKIVALDEYPKDEFKYDIIILDEFQDATEIFYQLVLKIIRDNQNQYPTMVVLGDRYQNINAYMGSDERYLMMADKLFEHVNNKPWIRCDLSISYRLSRECATFINNLLGYNRIETVKNGPKPKYIVEKNNKIASRIMQEVNYLIENGYNCDDIFILSNSVNTAKIKSSRGENPVLRIIKTVNSRLSDKIPIFLASDVSERNTQYLKDKMSIATYNSTKGLERKVVFMLNFDKGYYKSIRQEDEGILTNTQYVALTRSLEKIYIIHMESNERLSCIRNVDIIRDCCDITDEDFNKLQNIKASEPKLVDDSTIEVTQLLRFIPESLTIRICNNLEFEEVQLEGEKLKLKYDSKYFHNSSDGKRMTYKQTEEKLSLTEYLGNIYGEAIPLYFVYKNYRQNINILYDQIMNDKHYAKIKSDHRKCPRFIKSAYRRNMTLEDFFAEEWSNTKFACFVILYVSAQSGTYHMLDQITNIKWFKKQLFNKCNQRMKHIFSTYHNDENMLGVEVRASKSITLNGGTFNIVGRYDFVTNSTIIEWKCTTDIRNEHKLQVLLYKWLNNCERDVVIYNPLNNKYMKLVTDNIEEYVYQIMNERYGIKQPIPDEDFLKRNLSYIK